MARRLVFAALGAAVLSGGVYFTGLITNRYTVLPSIASIQAAGRTWSTKDLAARFEPLLHPRRGSETPTLCYYEPLPPHDGKAEFLYRFCWPDERHPNALANWLYLPFRVLVYGSKEDIEYVWVEADLKDLRPTRIAFEAPEVGKIFVRHIYELMSKGSFLMSGDHPILEVASWNHIFNVGSGLRTEPPAPLSYLDASTYRSLRMGRRSMPPDPLIKISGS